MRSSPQRVSNQPEQVPLSASLSFVTTLQNQFEPNSRHITGIAATSIAALSGFSATWLQISGFPGSLALAGAVGFLGAMGAASATLLRGSRDLTLRLAMLETVTHLKSRDFIPDMIVTLNGGALHCSGILVNRLGGTYAPNVRHYSLNAVWSNGAFDVNDGEADNIKSFAEKICADQGVASIKMLVVVSEVISGSSVFRLRRLLKCAHIDLRVFSLILHPGGTEPVDWFLKRSEQRHWLTWDRSPKLFSEEPPSSDGTKPPLTTPSRGDSSRSSTSAKVIHFPQAMEKEQRKSA